MRKSNLKAIFNISYPALMQLGDKGGSLITRDAAELLAYGVDAAYKQWLADKTQELKDFPTDIEVEGAVGVATENKNASADSVKVGVRAIMVRVKNVFDEATAKYRRFGTEGMNKFDDFGLLQCGKRVVRMATFYLPELAPKGLTQQIITDMAVINAQFDNDIDAQDDAIRSRDIATDDRLVLGNSLYSKISELFDYGKDYWVSRNEAKYNDYILNENSGGGGTPPSTDHFVFVTNQATLSPVTVDYISVTATGGEQVNNDWGDGYENPVTMQSGVYSSVTHNFTVPNEYTMNITDLQGGQPGGVIAVGELRIIGGKIISCNIPANAGIRNLTLNDNPIVTISIPATVGLYIINLANCNLNEASTNGVLIYADNRGLLGGTIHLEGGTNAPPSGLGIAAKNSLIAKGWTVITN